MLLQVQGMVAEYERAKIQERCRRGKRFWDSSTVWGMIKNPASKGTAAFGKTRLGVRRPRVRPQQGALGQPRRNYSTHDVPKEKWTHIPVPAIIGEDLFEVVREKLAENRARHRERLRGPSHLLQGAVVCGRCGCAYHGVRASKVT